MELCEGGLDLFYIDESNDASNYIVTAVAVPFLRPTSTSFEIVWDKYLHGSQDWRRRLASGHKIPTRHELHGSKLAKRRGNFKYGKRQFSQSEAEAAYLFALSELDFLPPGSIMSVTGRRGRSMYGEERLLRVMHALFQRMRMQCRGRNVNAMVFFDEGHPEYRSLYRKAKRYLLTGDGKGSAINRPLDMFIKDGNWKDSKFCNFTQIADLISYSVLHKMRVEAGSTSDAMPSIASAYDSIPPSLLNKRVSSDRDGIVRLG